MEAMLNDGRKVVKVCFAKSAPVKILDKCRKADLQDRRHKSCSQSTPAQIARVNAE